jgi:RNA polymerase sigma factor (sigma-70 family)
LGSKKPISVTKSPVNRIYNNNKSTPTKHYLKIGGRMVVDSLAENRKRLIQFLNAEIDSLAGILRVYLVRAGLAGDEDTAGELLNSVVVEALAHAQRYDPARPPRPWLLGIAANLVRRRQVEMARLNQREPLAGDLMDGQQTDLGEDELFDLLASHSVDKKGKDLHGEIEDRDSLTAALMLVTVDERRIIRMFAQSNLDGDAMAAALHVTPGAARVRLHRALAHLRRVWLLSEENNAHE